MNGLLLVKTNSIPEIEGKCTRVLNIALVGLGQIKEDEFFEGEPAL